MNPSVAPTAIPRRSRHRQVRNVVLAFLSVVVLSGCYRVNLKVDVQDDGSGTAEAVLAIDPEAMGGLMGSMGEMFEDLDTENGGTIPELGREEMCTETFNESFGEAPSGVTVEKYDEDGFCGQRRTISFASGDDISATLDQLMAESDGDIPDDGTFVIERSGDGWRFEATDLGAGAELDEAEGELISPEMMKMLMGDAEFTIEVQLPGRPVDHNATSVDGNTFTWEIDLLDPNAEPIFAVTESGSPDASSSAVTEPGSPDASSSAVTEPGSADSSSSPDSSSSLTWLWILLGVIVVGGLAFFIVKKRGSDDDDPSATPGAPGPVTPATAPSGQPADPSAWAPTPTPPPPVQTPPAQPSPPAPPAPPSPGPPMPPPGGDERSQ